jgi:hypothetical protein
LGFFVSFAVDVGSEGALSHLGLQFLFLFISAPLLLESPFDQALFIKLLSPFLPICLSLPLPRPVLLLILLRLKLLKLSVLLPLLPLVPVGGIRLKME